MPRPQLAIGPANYAGQAHAWASAVATNLPADAWSFSHLPLQPGGFQFEVDTMMGRYAYRNPALRGLRTRWLFRDATHVAIDGFKSFYHLRQRGKFPGDIEHLRRIGKRVALISHGSDTRSPEGHQERIPDSYFREGDEQWRATISASSRADREFAEQSGLPVFYSTPDLGHDLPFGTWLPVCIDVEAWAFDGDLLERRRPRVLHLPSKRNPPIKGSQYVEPVLDELDAAGVIERIPVPGSVPHAQVRELVRGADIVVDQVLAGFYGVAAVEAMAAGRVVVGGLADVRGMMPELPEIVEAGPRSLRSAIERIVEDRDGMRAAAVRNQAFVRRWHDGRESAHRLAGFLGIAPEVPA